MATFVAIADANEKEIYSGKYTRTLDVSGLSSGFYFLQLRDTDKKIVETKKIAIK